MCWLNFLSADFLVIWTVFGIVHLDPFLLSPCPSKASKRKYTVQQHFCHLLLFHVPSLIIYASNSPPWYLCMYYTLSRETEPSEYTTHQLSIHRVYTKYRQSIHCFSREYTAVCPPVPSQNHQTVLNNMLMRSLQRNQQFTAMTKFLRETLFFGSSLLWKPSAGFKGLQDC